MNEVLDTYFLFTEISDRLQRIVKGCQESEMPDAQATSLGFAAVGAGSGCWVEVQAAGSWVLVGAVALVFPENCSYRS